ncbi:MAG: hypothetical protein ACQETL_04475 [Bacteroidota bacterium]
MNVKILEHKNGKEVVSKISKVVKNKNRLPTITDGWRFNFRKNSKNSKYETYILSTVENANSVEGCLIIDTNSPYEIYMAYIEIAPHNKGENKKYAKVAGCLIAFACRRSFIEGKEGYLAFDVKEEDIERKLMELYSNKYNAVRLSNSTTMIILPEASEKLIELYLK